MPLLVLKGDTGKLLLLPLLQASVHRKRTSGSSSLPLRAEVLVPAACLDLAVGLESAAADAAVAAVAAAAVVHWFLL